MKINRMISIIMILLERKKITVSELAKICEVTTRTIQRDLDAINMAGVPIVSFPGVGGGVSIMENYKLEKRLFSTTDVIMLLTGLSSIHPSLRGDEVINALAKIKGLIPEEQREAIELKAGQITIDTTPWMGSRSYGQLIELLQTALQERKLIHFTYNDRLQNKSVRTVEPYRLILKSMNWYFEGFCLERKAFRIFKLSRISGAVKLDELYEPRVFSFPQIFQPAFEDKHIISATLRVKEAALEQLTDLFGLECIEQESPDTWLAKIAIFDNENGYKFLLGLGRDCECLCPESLRNNLKQYLRQTSALYD